LDLISALPHHTLLPCDTTCKHGTSCQTLVFCIQTAKDIVKLLSQPASTIILFSWSHLVLPKGGVKYTGWKHLRFL